MDIDSSLLNKVLGFGNEDDYNRRCENCVHSYLILMDGIGICRLRNAYVHYCYTCENFCSNGKEEEVSGDDSNREDE